jgi:hypothetical protein
MAGDHGLSDLRFDGYDNEDLALQVDGLRQGVGAETLNDAVSSLMRLAEGLAETDQTLRKQLQGIGVSWQGQASEGGTSATENASIYAEEAQGPVADSAKGVDYQGAVFTTTKNGAPDSGTLRGPTEENTVDQIAGFFGHTTDHAQQVKETTAARNAAVDAMNGYRDNSSDAISQSQALPVPPGMNINAQPVDTGTSVSSVSTYSPTGGGAFNPTGTGPGGSGPNTSFSPGGNPPITGGGPTPGNPLFPSTANPLNPSVLRAANPMLMAEAATMMGAGGASGAGAGAEGERLSRNAANRGPIKNGMPIGSVPEEEARAARNAEKFGARTGRGGGSIMQPAAAGAGRNAEGEDDQEHVRRYGVESSDVFDDDRVVAPESIGDDDDR